MKRFLKRLGYIFLIPLVVITILLFPVYESDAATLSAAYVMLSRIKTSLTGSANLDLYIAFTPTSNITDDTDTIVMTLEFPMTDNADWCATAGTLTVAGVSATPADSTGTYDIDTDLPGTLSASCTQGNGSTTVDTITVTGITQPLSASTTYGVKISDPDDESTTGGLGTSTTGTHVVNLTLTGDGTPTNIVESKAFGIDLVADDQVVVSAEVASVPTVDCSISTNAVNLGTLYKGGSYVTGTHTISTSTSDTADGYYWAIYGYGNGTTAGLYLSGTDLIASSGNPTIDISTPGSQGFGVNVVEPTGATAGSGFSDSSNSAGVFGTLGSGQSNAELFLYQQVEQSASPDEATVIYGARAGTSISAGSYTETVTFVCGGYY